MFSLLNIRLALLVLIIIFLIFIISLWRNRHYTSGMYVYSRIIILSITLVLSLARGFFLEKSLCQFNKTILNHETTIQGSIYKKEIKNDQEVVYINNIQSSDYQFDSSIKMIIYPDSGDYSIDDIIIIQGFAKGFSKAKNPGNFDQTTYYKGLGIFATIKQGQINLAKDGSGLKEGLFHIQQNMKAVYANYLYEEEVGIAAAIALGDRSELISDVKSLFQNAGMSHILAISGLHISIVGMGLNKLLRRRFGLGLSNTISTIIVILYGLMCQSSMSAVRAVGMYAIMCLASTLGEAYDILNALAFMFVYVLWINPFGMLSSGFVFTFSTVLGIALVLVPVNNKYSEYCRIRFRLQYMDFNYNVYKPSLKERIIASLLASLCLQLITIPLVAYYYFEIPVYTVLVNFLVLPFIGLLLANLLISGVLGLIFNFKISILIQEILLNISHYGIFYYESLADVANNLRGSHFITGRPNLFILITYYFALVILVKAISSIDISSHAFVKKRFSINKKLLISSIFFFCIFVILLINPQKKAFSINMIDVGQGDGILITSKSGDNYFIDGGSTSIDDVATYNILPYLKYSRIRSIDYWFVSHTDLDHISGLMEALELGYRIDYVVLDSVMLNSDNYEELENLCRKNNTEILLMNRGDKLDDGYCLFTCLAPAGDIRDVEDINSMSMVLLLEGEDCKALFTGDITSEQEEEILDMYREKLYNVDVLKVAHHGSKTASSAKWIESLNPNYALISAGENNSYGHPNQEVVKRLTDAGCKVYCTIDRGLIRLE